MHGYVALRAARRHRVNGLSKWLLCAAKPVAVNEISAASAQQKLKPDDHLPLCGFCCPGPWLLLRLPILNLRTTRCIDYRVAGVLVYRMHHLHPQRTVWLGSTYCLMQTTGLSGNGTGEAQPSKEPWYLNTALVPMLCCYAAQDRLFGRHKPNPGTADPRCLCAFLLRSLSTFGNSVL